MRTAICPICRAVKYIDDDVVIPICYGCQAEMEKSFDGGQGIKLKKEEKDGTRTAN